MENNEIFNKLQAFVSEILEEKVTLNSTTALIGEGILDSLEFMNYITKVEEHFDISLEDDDIENKQLGIISNMIEHLSK